MKNSGVQIDKIRTKRVVIVGAGFAGLACAKALASDRNLRITVIDKNNYHQFQPLLYQVATGILSTGNAAFNLRALLQRSSQHRCQDVGDCIRGSAYSYRRRGVWEIHTRRIIWSWLQERSPTTLACLERPSLHILSTRWTMRSSFDLR